MVCVLGMVFYLLMKTPASLMETARQAGVEAGGQAGSQAGSRAGRKAGAKAGEEVVAPALKQTIELLNSHFPEIKLDPRSVLAVGTVGVGADVGGGEPTGDAADDSQPNGH
jgi:hypothetical protein